MCASGWGRTPMCGRTPPQFANRPPSAQAAAIAARLHGAAAEDPVIDLDGYRRLTQGEAS